MFHLGHVCPYSNICKHIIVIYMCMYVYVLYIKMYTCIYNIYIVVNIYHWNQALNILPKFSLCIRQLDDAEYTLKWKYKLQYTIAMNYTVIIMMIM